MYFRADVTSNNPEGSRWAHIAIPKGLEACQVAVSGQGVPFVVTWTGSFLFRVGLTPHNLAGIVANYLNRVLESIVGFIFYTHKISL